MLSGHEFRAFCKLPMRLPKLVLRSQGGLTCPTMALHQDPDVPYQDWQCSTSRALDGRAAAEHRRTVGPAELALLRVLLLRRLWFPLLLALARCRSRRPFDVLGDHVAACDSEVESDGRCREASRSWSTGPEPWEAQGKVDLKAELRHPMPTLPDVPVVRW
eukprot:s3530_g1.t1